MSCTSAHKKSGELTTKSLLFIWKRRSQKLERLFHSFFSLIPSYFYFCSRLFSTHTLSLIFSIYVFFSLSLSFFFLFSFFSKLKSNFYYYNILSYYFSFLNSFCFFIIYSTKIEQTWLDPGIWMGRNRVRTGENELKTREWEYKRLGKNMCREIHSLHTFILAAEEMSCALASHSSWEKCHRRQMSQSFLSHPWEYQFLLLISTLGYQLVTQRQFVFD